MGMNPVLAETAMCCACRQAALAVNTSGIHNVLGLAATHQLRVFAPSTIAVFGPSSPRSNTPDSCIMEPTTVYGVTKVYQVRCHSSAHTAAGSVCTNVYTRACACVAAACSTIHTSMCVCTAAGVAGLLPHVTLGAGRAQPALPGHCVGRQCAGRGHHRLRRCATMHPSVTF